MTVKFPIYLDSHATTPVDPRVYEAMRPYFTERFGNPSSVDHTVGHDASVAVQHSREQIASVINAHADEIVFTSGATESDNLAILGIMTEGSHMITCTTEHRAVLDTVGYLESRGCSATYLQVDKDGLVDTESLQEAITPETALVSIMFANNEIGTIHNITEIGRIAHENAVLFHTDAAQAVGHVPVDVQKMNIDLMSFSSHKIYGPKGIGALYVRGVRPRVKLAPLIHGGGQERNIRSGTLNVPGIVGFAKAISIAEREMSSERDRCHRWAGRMLDSLPGARLNGHRTRRLAHNLSVRFDGVDGKAVINSISKKVAISAGSACTAQSVEPSHVLLALGLTLEQAHSSIRIGFGRFNTDEEIEVATDVISNSVNRLREIAE